MTFYPIPPSEHLVEMKICRQCSTDFPITDRDILFYSKVSPTFEGKKFLIPSPTLCPDCRQQRRLAFRNERKLYKRKCDATGNDIVSIYSPDSKFKVFSQEYWWGDAWDPLQYRRDFDFEKSAIKQFRELMWVVPRPALLSTESENSEYSQTCTRNKNCYLVFESSFNEDCYFGYWVHYAKDIVDCSFCDRMESSYESLDCQDGYNLFYCQSCSNCHNSYYLENCIGCEFCFGSINQRNKKYVFMNEQYSEKEYFELLTKYLSTKTRWEIKMMIDVLFRKSIHQSSKIVESENCSWDFIRHAKNCHSCFYVFEWAENAKYMCNTWLKVENVIDGDAVWAEGGYVYESINTALKSYYNAFCFRAWGVNRSYYVCECDFSSHLFLCTWLRHKEYCILNKQYTKEEYEILVPKIIEKMMRDGEWGEFFPASLSPFGYNETVASEYFPLSRDEVLCSSLRGTKQSSTTEVPKTLDRHASLHSARDDERPQTFLHWPLFNWSDYEAPFPKVEKIIPASKLPDEIRSIPDDILNWAIECEVSGRPFRIIRQELEFYRKHNIPIPRRHPDVRHMDRMKKRNPRKLWERKCDHCEKMMITTYAPERPETVYCESCYEREVLL
jgi:hypothetical protein